MLRQLLAGSLLLASLSAYAEGLSYSFAELNYVKGDIDAGSFGDIDFDGLAANVSYGFNENVFGQLGYAEGEIDDTIRGVRIKSDLADTFTLGVGAHTNPEGGRVNLFGVLSFVRVDDADENGYGIQVGIRGLATDSLELNAAVSYVNFGEDERGEDVDGESYGVGAVYSFTPKVAGVLGYSDDGDAVSAFNLGARIYF